MPTLRGRPQCLYQYIEQQRCSHVVAIDKRLFVFGCVGACVDAAMQLPSSTSTVRVFRCNIIITLLFISCTQRYSSIGHDVLCCAVCRVPCAACYDVLQEMMMEIMDKYVQAGEALAEKENDVRHLTKQVQVQCQNSVFTLIINRYFRHISGILSMCCMYLVCTSKPGWASFSAWLICELRWVAVTNDADYMHVWCR